MEKIKICQLPACGDPIPDGRHKNATTCCKEHAMLLKKERETLNKDKIHYFYPY